MIEILASVYIVSMILSVSLVSWHYSSTRRQLQSNRLKNLNRNLSELGMFWSHSNGTFESFNEGTIEEDRRRSLKNILWLGGLSFFSVIGFLLLTAVIFSVRYLAKSRLEVAVFESPLAMQVNLPVVEAETLVLQFKSAYGVR
jgi:hypothetical protein